MSDITDKLLGVTTDERRNRLLEHQVFKKQSLLELVFGPTRSIDEEFLVKNCVFSDCSITQGLFLIFQGVTLEHVTFENVSSPDFATISTEAVLNNVIFKGEPKPGGVWIKPLEILDPKLDAAYREWAASKAQNIDLMLDVSDFWGYVEIIGLPLAKVKINPKRHYVVTKEWHEVDWDHLGIPRTSFWRIVLMRIDDFDVDACVFSLPGRRERNYDQICRELKLLRASGLEIPNLEE